MSGIVLDASALLAMLKEEAGGTQVAEALADSRMCAVNYAEVITHFIHAGTDPGYVNDALRPLPMILVPADTELAILAGRLRAQTAEAGLSLGDRFCLALALRDGLPAWTADKQWRAIATKTGVEVIYIR